MRESGTPVSGRLLARLPVVETAAISPDGRFVATVGYGERRPCGGRGRPGSRSGLLPAAWSSAPTPSSWPPSTTTAARASGERRQAGRSRPPRVRQPQGPEPRAHGCTASSRPARPSATTAACRAGERRRQRPDLGRRGAQAGRDRRHGLGERAGLRTAGTHARGDGLERGGRGRTVPHERSAPHGLPAEQLRSRLRPAPDPPTGSTSSPEAAGGAGVWAVDGHRVATLMPPARPAAMARTSDGRPSAATGRRSPRRAPSAGASSLLGELHGTAVWRLGQRRPLREVRTSGPPRLDTNGRLVAVGGEVWRTSGGEPLPGLGEVLLLSPDGTVALVFRGGGFEVVETASGKTVAALRDAEPLRRGERLHPRRRVV